MPPQGGDFCGGDQIEGSCHVHISVKRDQAKGTTDAKA